MGGDGEGDATSEEEEEESQEEEREDGPAKDAQNADGAAKEAEKDDGEVKEAERDDGEVKEAEKDDGEMKDVDEEVPRTSSVEGGEEITGEDKDREMASLAAHSGDEHSPQVIDALLETPDIETKTSTSVHPTPHIVSPHSEETTSDGALDTHGSVPSVTFNLAPPPIFGPASQAFVFPPPEPFGLPPPVPPQPPSPIPVSPLGPPLRPLPSELAPIPARITRGTEKKAQQQANAGVATDETAMNIDVEPLAAKRPRFSDGAASGSKSKRVKKEIIDNAAMDAGKAKGAKQKKVTPENDDHLAYSS